MVPSFARGLAVLVSTALRAVLASNLARGLAFVLALLGAPAGASSNGSIPIFHDDFESLSNCVWSGGTVALAPAIGLGATMGTLAAGDGTLAGSCLGPARELVFAFTPPTTATLHVELDSVEDLGFYLLDGCFSGAEFLCVDDVNGGGVEAGQLDVTAGSTIYLVVDGWPTTGADFDLTLSTSFCGNNLIEPPELCDGLDLGGHTCFEFGFAGGVLLCNPGCQSFDTSLCIPI